MKVLKLFLVIISIFLVCIMTGCERQEVVSPEDASLKYGIQAAIDELPERLNCRRLRETEFFVYSNICCVVRQIDDSDKRIHHSVAYTNKVLEIMPTVVSGRTQESLENWRINLENYIAMVRWGFVLLDKWQREINTYWYEGARRRMGEQEFEVVRKKVNDAFVGSSSEDAKDESIALYERGIRLGMGRGCKKDPIKALEAMRAADRLGYGSAALVCAMATEIKQGWMTTEDIGTNVVTAASRLRTYIGTADIGGWYDIYKGRPFVSSLGKKLEDD